MRKLTLLSQALLALFVLLAVAPGRAQDVPPVPQLENSRWDGERRFTILVMGMDRRPGARDTLSVRTDAVLLVSLNPAADSVGILHIPRDLHVPAPDTQPMVRVNTLMLRGEELQEGYGPYYMMDVLQYNFGLFIDAYVAFDFEAFIAIVDILGGVEVTTNYVINDPTYPDMNYGYDPFYLPSGTHLLDGHQALQFARTRHGDNDYLRGERQMQVLTAMGLRATDPAALAQLIANAPQLRQQLEDKIYTDLTTEEMIQLGLFAARVPLDRIQTGAINPEYMDAYYTSGTSVQIPDRERMVELLTRIFGAGYSG